MEWLFAKRNIPTEIVDFINTIFELIEIRGKIGTSEGVEFSIRTNEANHTIPHVHAKYGEYEISISLEDGRILAGNLPPKRTAIATKWVQGNKEKLMTSWNSIAISATSSTTKSLLNTSMSEDYEEAGR